MTEIIVDDRAWIPEDYVGTAATGSEVREAGPAPGSVFESMERRFILMERLVFLGESPPDLLVCADQIACFDPVLVPARDDDGKAAFPEMSEPFDAEGSEIALGAARKRGIAASYGCVVGLRDPSLLTPAERAALALLGADAACRWLHLAVRRARARGAAVIGLGVGPRVEVEVLRGLIADLL